MTTYTIISSPPEPIEAPSHRDAHRQLCQRLKVSGPRALTAQAENGRVEIHASLYGDDYIRTRDGRLLGSW